MIYFVIYKEMGIFMNTIARGLEYLSTTATNVAQRYDYERTYKKTSYVIIFFTFSCIGWLWEILYTYLTEGQAANRGVLNGPWLPVYGMGAVMSLLVYRLLKNKRPTYLFGMIMLFAAIIEYTTGVYLEKTYGMRWWDYRDLTFQLHGRICLRGLIFFGAAGLFIVYIAAPRIDEFTERFSNRFLSSLALLLLFLLLFDIITSSQSPNMGRGITYTVFNTISPLIRSGA